LGQLDEVLDKVLKLKSEWELYKWMKSQKFRKSKSETYIKN